MHDDVDGYVVHVLGAIVDRGRRSQFELSVDFGVVVDQEL